MKKFISTILILTLALLCLGTASCEETASYSTDTPVSELISVSIEKIPEGDTMISVPDDYIGGFMQLEVSDFEEYAVMKKTTGSSIDEFGIFKAPSSDAVNSVKESVSAYLTMYRESYMGSYTPEEVPKLEDASIKVMGQYVVYCILDGDVKSDVFSAVDNKLLGK